MTSSDLSIPRTFPFSFGAHFILYLLEDEGGGWTKGGGTKEGKLSSSTWLGLERTICILLCVSETPFLQMVRIVFPSLQKALEIYCA
ncbi:hypothetical protein CEXT_374911 [Caerostris extrusa]|uniref:Uncharacterized protein n=1 Tax=Caerostris extrusa TaxID=172846 RepID=A0AAV4Y4B4_CAEEX|nr:hypothetical protein CEXT_374911 [Caerostris extrusa]